LCLYKTSNKQQAEDLVQEAFVRLWNSMSEQKEIDNPKAFLYQIARNLIVDFYRKKKALSLDGLQEQGFEPSNIDHEQIENKSEISIVVKVIEKLDEKYRDVVYLKLVEDMDITEIAKTLKITNNNATVRFHRGMKYLKLLIENN
ncbi:MAG: RNA polymerase sigma factor, partial [Candidatus Nomurabacteria bacterium]|nr:RNA polymerase sigma factor [Candidatus Nomurabacteria bacterium]